MTGPNSLRPTIPNGQVLIDKTELQKLKTALKDASAAKDSQKKLTDNAKRQRDTAIQGKKDVEKDYYALQKDHDELKTKVEELLKAGKGKSNNVHAKILQSSDVVKEIEVFVREYVCRTIKFIQPGPNGDKVLEKATFITWEGLKERLKLEQKPKSLTRQKFSDIYGSAVLNAVSVARQYAQTRGQAAAKGTNLVYFYTE